MRFERGTGEAVLPEVTLSYRVHMIISDPVFVPTQIQLQAFDQGYNMTDVK